MYYYLRSVDDDAEVKGKLNKTINATFTKTDKCLVLDAKGDTPFERTLYLAYFNTYVATYCAVLNGYDPFPAPTLNWLKNTVL